jgi:hypothetical protein
MREAAYARSDNLQGSENTGISGQKVDIKGAGF